MKPSLVFSQISALWLTLGLILPDPVLALHPLSPTESAGLEEEIQEALTPAAGLEGRPPELNVEQADPSLDRFQLLTKEIQTALAPLAPNTPVDFRIVAGLAQKINPQFGKRFPIGELLRTDPERVAGFLEELLWKVYLPTGRIFSYRFDGGGPQFFYSSIREGTWRPERYLDTEIWMAEIEPFRGPEEQHPEYEHQMAIGRLGFLDPQGAREDPLLLKSYGSLLTSLPEDLPATFRELQFHLLSFLAASEFRLSWKQVVPELSEVSLRQEMRRYAQDYAYAQLREKQDLRMNPDADQLVVKAILKPGTTLYDQWTPSPARSESEQKLLDLSIRTLAGRLGGAISAIRIHLERKNPDLAYATFLSFLGNMERQANDPSELGLKPEEMNLAKWVTTKLVVETGKLTMEEFLRFLREGEGHPAVRSMELLEQVYGNLFFTDAERAVKRPSSTTGLEEYEEYDVGSLEQLSVDSRKRKGFIEVTVGEPLLLVSVEKPDREYALLRVTPKGGVEGVVAKYLSRGEDWTVTFGERGVVPTFIRVKPRLWSSDVFRGTVISILGLEIEAVRKPNVGLQVKLEEKGQSNAFFFKLRRWPSLGWKPLGEAVKDLRRCMSQAIRLGRKSGRETLDVVVALVNTLDGWETDPFKVNGPPRGITDQQLMSAWSREATSTEIRFPVSLKRGSFLRWARAPYRSLYRDLERVARIGVAGWDRGEIRAAVNFTPEKGELKIILRPEPPIQPKDRWKVDRTGLEEPTNGPSAEEFIIKKVQKSFPSGGSLPTADQLFMWLDFWAREQGSKFVFRNDRMGFNRRAFFEHIASEKPEEWEGRFRTLLMESVKRSDKIQAVIGGLLKRLREQYGIHRRIARIAFDFDPDVHVPIPGIETLIADSLSYSGDLRSYGLDYDPNREAPETNEDGLVHVLRVNLAVPLREDELVPIVAHELGHALFAADIAKKIPFGSFLKANLVQPLQDGVRHPYFNGLRFPCRDYGNLNPPENLQWLVILLEEAHAWWVAAQLVQGEDGRPDPQVGTALDRLAGYHLEKLKSASPQQKEVTWGRAFRASAVIGSLVKVFRLEPTENMKGLERWSIRTGFNYSRLVGDDTTKGDLTSFLQRLSFQSHPEAAGLEESTLQKVAQVWKDVVATPRYAGVTGGILPVLNGKGTFSGIPFVARLARQPLIALVDSQAGLEQVQILMESLSIDPNRYRIWRLDQGLSVSEALVRAQQEFPGFHPYLVEDRPHWLRDLLAGLEEMGILPVPVREFERAVETTQGYFQAA